MGWVFKKYPGGDLLSRKLYRHYHRPGSVSRPCSEWERVGPLRQCHQEIFLKNTWFSDNCIQEGHHHNRRLVVMKSPGDPREGEIK